LGVDAIALEQLAQRAARLVPSHHGQQIDARTERGRIAGDVRRAARPLFHAIDLHHRHRRLGRDAPDLTKPVPIEHYVAHHQDADVAQPGQRLTA